LGFYSANPRVMLLLSNNHNALKILIHFSCRDLHPSFLLIFALCFLESDPDLLHLEDLSLNLLLARFVYYSRVYSLWSLVLSSQGGVSCSYTLFS
jgi:hypothetical protein